MLHPKGNYTPFGAVFSYFYTKENTLKVLKLTSRTTLLNKGQLEMEIKYILDAHLFCNRWKNVFDLHTCVLFWFWINVSKTKQQNNLPFFAIKDNWYDCISVAIGCSKTLGKFVNCEHIMTFFKIQYNLLFTKVLRTFS